MILNISNKGLTGKFVVPRGVRGVYCRYNHLKELVLPAGVKEVHCWGNQLTELVVGEGTRVDCDSNVKVIRV